MFRCGWVPSLFTWNYHSIVDRLCPNTKQRSLVKILKIEIITAKKKPKTSYWLHSTIHESGSLPSSRQKGVLRSCSKWKADDRQKGAGRRRRGRQQSRLAVARSLSFSGQRPQWWSGGSWLAGSRFHFWQNWDCNSVRSQCANMWLGTISQFILVLLLSCF